MPIQSGTKLGPYEVGAPLGAGGMGEVYRAKDTRLDRTVAIKVLPSHLSSNPDLQQRFEREARAVSSLNHPNICTLHDVGRQDGMAYLVMEYIEGQTLAARFQKGPLPLRELLQYSIQIADALDKAHRKGITHRDLKPGNIMITKAGIKLLDFGLAKLQTDQKSAPEVSSLLTGEKELTREGTILGTVQYMAPEQLEGKPADARTDIFSFGAVMYEMATGKKAFEGNSQASLIAAILKEEPKPLSHHQSLTPPALERLVKTCFEKDPEDRWQNVHDLLTELRWIADEGTQSSVSVVPAKRKSVREGIAWGLAALLAAAVVILMVMKPKETEPQVQYSTILAPENGTLISSSLFAGPVVISPDGLKLAFSAQVGEGPQLLWVRSLDSSTAVALRGTEDAQMPFWFPDSRFLGFFAGHKLKKIPATGGLPSVLTSIGESRGGTWNQDGTILFSQDARGPIYRVSANGGAVSLATQLKADEYTHRYPSFLPDGRHFLYLVRKSIASTGADPAIYVGSLDSFESKRVVPVASNVFYASGHIFYVKEGALVAHPFDFKDLAVHGEPTTVSEDVRMDERFARGVFSVSQNGKLVYQTGNSETMSELRWLDRSGKVLETIGDPAHYFNGGNPEISPEGKNAITSILDVRTGLVNIWMVDLVRHVRNKFTVGQRDNFGGTWKYDGSGIAASISTQSGGYELLLKSVTGTSKDEKLISSEDVALPCSWSRDGRYFLYETRVRKTGVTGALDDLFVLSLADRKSQPIAPMKGFEGMGQFSPDSRFIAYVSDESGRKEVYVSSFPDTGGKWQVSQNGGTEPRWRADGAELFFFDLDNRLMAAQIAINGPGMQVGIIEPLFQSRIMGISWRYDARDGQRFLVNCALPEKNTSAITLIQNWQALLNSK